MSEGFISFEVVLSLDMSQTRFSFILITPRKKKDLEQALGEIYHTIKNKFKSFETFQKVLLESSAFASQDLKDEQAPEEFTKRCVIEPLIRFLGFEIVAETVLASPEGRREPDYKIRPEKKKEPMFYVEAEPINIDLYSKGHGKSQVDNWLLSRVSETDYGIATDGLKWIIFKFDTASAKSKVLDLKIDFRPFFLKMLNPHSFTYANEIERAEEDFLKLDCEIISVFLSNYLEKIEKDKEEITKRFYNDYVKYVFGVDEKGNTAEGVCLLNKVLAPPNTAKKDVNLFSVVFMNRLIFMKFLEEKKIIPKDFLKKLDDNYKSSGAPSSFYETYFRPLFYEVFNKNKNDRISRVRSNPFYNDVPYLNGGLFREVVVAEENYTVENEGVELILEYIEKYSFSSESGIRSRDILGYIFERTINFISGTGTNQQKMQGAYYTFQMML